MCLDTFGRKAGEKIGMADCHGLGGNQVRPLLVPSFRSNKAWFPLPELMARVDG